MSVHFHITNQSPRIVEHVHPYRRRHVHEGLRYCTSSRAKAERLLADYKVEREAYLRRRGEEHARRERMR